MLRVSLLRAYRRRCSGIREAYRKMIKIDWDAPFPEILRQWALANHIRTGKEVSARLGVKYWAWVEWVHGRRECPAAGALTELMRLKMDRRLLEVPPPPYAGLPFPAFMCGWMDDLGFRTLGAERPYKLKDAASALRTSVGTWRAWFREDRHCAHEDAFRELMLLKRAARNLNERPLAVGDRRAERS